MKITLLLFLTLTIYACDSTNSKVAQKDSNKSNELSEKPETGYTSMEIYCWGFHSDSLITVKDCMPTGGGITPSELVDSKVLIRTVKSIDTIKALRDMIFVNKKDLGPAKHGCESRFLILFKKNDSVADTIVHGGKEVLCFNDKSLFNYTFNVMDSIKHILGTKEISCDCKTIINHRLTPK